MSMKNGYKWANLGQLSLVHEDDKNMFVFLLSDVEWDDDDDHPLGLESSGIL